MGGYVIVTNCEKVTVSGKKYLYKRYFRHTVGRPGKMKIENFRDLQNVILNCFNCVICIIIEDTRTNNRKGSEGNVTKREIGSKTVSPFKSIQR